MILRATASIYILLFLPPTLSNNSETTALTFQLWLSFSKLFQTNPYFKVFPSFCSFICHFNDFSRFSVELIFLLRNRSLYLWRFSLVSMFALYDNVIASKAFYTWCLRCCCSVAQSCATVCDPMDCSTPGFPILHRLPELAQTSPLSR